MTSNQHHIITTFYREHSGKLYAALARVLGVNRIELIEDVVQDTMLKALEAWQRKGTPKDPAPWLFKTARNTLIDLLRKEQVRQGEGTVSDEELAVLQSYAEGIEGLGEILNDDVLRTIFSCCDPAVSAETQLGMTLRLVCGMNTNDVAAALLKTPDTTGKLIRRGKQRLAETGIITDLSANHIQQRLSTVLRTIYLLFNNGFKAASGDTLLRVDLCVEAIRLARILARHELTDNTETHAFLSLLLFHAVRFPERINDDGSLKRLEDQERSNYIAELLEEAQNELNIAAQGNELSRYHLEAGIAACHSFANTYEETDWQTILQHYDLLVQVDPSPVVKLNRIVAVLHNHGVELAQKALTELRKETNMLEQYYPMYCLTAELALQKGKPERAREELKQAKSLANNEVEKAFIDYRLESLH